MRALEAAIPIALAAIACGDTPTIPAEAQFLVRVDTDAPLPSAEGAVEPALFDRLRVELFPPGADDPCPGCTREFPADRELFASGRASFGFATRAEGPGYRARVRLYRSAWLVNGEPLASSTLETFAALPDAPAEGVRGATVALRIQDVGRPRGSAKAPVAAEDEGAPRLGLWEGARRVPCAGAPREGEACVPGGAFWMGDPAIVTFDTDAFDGDLPRVVSVSPFFVDLHETTVGEWRAAHGNPAPRVGDPGISEGVNARCTLTPAPGPNEDKPLLCVSREVATEHCASRGRALLTEAQFEYLASGLAGFPYPWGRDHPECGDAVYARDPSGTDRTKACFRRGAGSSIAPPGTGARDRLVLEGGTVVDVAGNASEWVQDTWKPQTDPTCWGVGAFRDPVCRGAGEASVRGGNWVLFDIALRAQLRTHLPDTRPSTGVGFRCARSS